MSWSQDFCLACDRQTDGSNYCGESCRLAEYEKANSSSEASSPTQQRFNSSWPSPGSYGHNFHLPTAYNFSSHRSTSSRPQSAPVAPSSKLVLTPSSSQSSLISMQSNASTTSDSSYVSEAARRELKAYASSFDQSRYTRRQSQ